jgi:NAD+ kinase
MHSTPAFRHAAIVGKAHTKSGDSAARDAVNRVAEYVQSSGIWVSVESTTAAALDVTAWPALEVAAIGAQCDVVIAVGGDGTVLGIGRQIAQFGLPLVGINQGRLGFMTDIALDHLDAALGPVLHGHNLRDERMLLCAEVVRDDQVIHRSVAMNDVVVSRGATAGMVELKVEVDGAYMYNQRADGLIAATPTGSTAYSLSANGPIVHPQLSGFLLVPIAPHSLSNRPIVLPDHSTVEIEIVGGKDASVNFDMQSVSTLMHGDKVVVRKSQHSCLLLHPKDYSYYSTLRNKLGWHEH